MVWLWKEIFFKKQNHVIGKFIILNLRIFSSKDANKLSKFINWEEIYSVGRPNNHHELMTRPPPKKRQETEPKCLSGTKNAPFHY